jgi:hypothetical protein
MDRAEGTEIPVKAEKKFDRSAISVYQEREIQTLK